VTDKNASLAIHAGCVALIAACFALSYTVLKPYPQASSALVILAWWLWGKLGFKPADPVLARILQGLDPSTVARLSNRPPAPDAPKPVPGDSDYQVRQ